MKNKFSKDAKLFLSIQMLFALSTALSATFVNVYMWRLTSDLRYIGVYNIVVYAFTPITFVLSGKIARKKGITTCTRLGILGYLMFYLLILLLRESVKDYLIPLGALFGCGMGFYYFGNNTLIYHYTEQNNRGYYLGVSGALGSVMGTLAPIVSGWIIISKQALQGYYIVFIVSFILFLAAIALSNFLHQEKIEGKFEFKSILISKKDRQWRKILVSSLILGFRDGALGYIVSILIFIAFKNELNMGKFTTLTSLLAILSSYIIGRYYRKSLANQLFFIGSVMCFVSTVVLVMWTNYTGVFINGVLTAVFTCFWNIPLGTLVYDIAGKRASKSNNMGDYMIVREIPTAVGRIASILLYIIVSRSFMDATAIKIILPFLSFMIIINFIYLRKSNM